MQKECVMSFCPAFRCVCSLSNNTPQGSSACTSLAISLLYIVLGKKRLLNYLRWFLIHAKKYKCTNCEMEMHVTSKQQVRGHFTLTPHTPPVESSFVSSIFHLAVLYIRRRGSDEGGMGLEQRLCVRECQHGETGCDVVELYRKDSG